MRASIGFSGPWRRNAVPATCSAGPATVADPPGREGTALSRLAANLSRPRSRRKLADFHDAAVEARRPEVAEKGLALWPAILVARGLNRMKQTNRLAAAATT